MMKPLLAACALLTAPTIGHAQPARWPERPVRVIVPLAPGGSVDIIARMVGARLSERLGQQFIVDNRTGAGSTIGIAIASRATPDGYTLLMMSPAFAASAALYRLSYDPVKDIAPVGMIAEGGMFLAVNLGVKAASVKELIEFARAHPNALKYGSGGTGSSTHLATELFRQMTRTEFVHVPYKGIGPALADLVSGQIQFYIAPAAALIPHTSSGRLRLVAATGEQRPADMPELPTIAETVPGYAATFWYGLGAPAGTPRHIITLLNQELARMLKQTDLPTRLRVYDLDPALSAPEDFSGRIAKDIAMWSRVVKASNIKLD